MLRICCPLMSLAIFCLTSVVWAQQPAAAPDAAATAPTTSAFPKGEITKHTFDQSKVFPGTTRDYWIYIPRQYDASKPACLYVNQDRVQFSAPDVFDELIAKKEMPVTIAVFVQPGVVKAPSEQALNRFNRSYEYDSLGDNYAKFLLDELLPEVEKKTAADGRAIKLSRDPNDRAIGGSSSGAIAAFTAAWERPDSFHRVFSSIGTYVGLRGGNEYPTLIRKFEPKPLRVFLEDGSADQNAYGGDWWMANQEMERALTYAGYEVNHFWGDGGHNAKQATAILPDAMRWLWKDHPAPIKVGLGSDKLKEILIPGEEWQVVKNDLKSSDGPVANAKGEVFFNDARENKTYKVGLDGNVSVFLSDSKNANGQAFGPDGRLYASAAGIEKIVAYDTDGKMSVIADGFRGNDVVVGSNGGIYVTVSGPNQAPTTSATSNTGSKVMYVNTAGEKKEVDTGLKLCNGVAMSPDQSLLYVNDMRSRWVYSYQIQPDGSLALKQKYYHLHVPDTADDSGADGMRVDREGRLYVTTRMGIQVCDQAGRVNCIIPTPNGKVSNLTWGGENFDTLYAVCGNTLYKRKVKTKGCNSFEAPIKPAAPKL